MEKVRFAIIGVGNMGSVHAKNLLSGKVPDAVLAAICDLRPERMAAVTSQPGGETVRCFADYHELLRSGAADAVIIATPHYLHPTIAMEAFAAGLHVLSEKPAGVYTKQVKEMNRAAEKSGKLFTLMFNQRTNCLYRKMREMIAAGELGAVRRINWIITDWYRSQSYYDSGDWRATWRGEGGGVLFNQCPHQLDLLWWITGMMPSRIRAFCRFGQWHDIEVEDDVTAYLEYENGATGVFITTTADTPGTNRLEITGNNGKLVCENGKLLFDELEVPERVFNATYKGGFGTPAHHLREVETDGENPQHIGILRNFARAILSLEPLYVDGREGLRGVELMDAMLLSTWQDRTVTLPIDDDLYLDELNKRIATGRVKTGGGQVLNTDGTYGGAARESRNDAPAAPAANGETK